LLWRARLHEDGPRILKTGEVRMYYAQLNPKQKRIIERDVETLFTPAALLANLTPEKIKKLGMFHPTIKIGRGLMFLSETGVSAVRRIGDLLAGLPAFSNCIFKK
jgi:hypothetical protein